MNNLMPLLFSLFRKCTIIHLAKIERFSIWLEKHHNYLHFILKSFLTTEIIPTKVLYKHIFMHTILFL